MELNDRPVLLPNPQHPISIEANPNRVVVKAGDRIIADTRNALTLREADLPPVQYIPRADANMAELRRSVHASYCPFKGDAGYFDVVALGEEGRNAVWTYEQPFDAVSAIDERLAFYPNKVTVLEHSD